MLSDLTCNSCPRRDICTALCAPVEAMLPAEDAGRHDSLHREGAFHAAFRLVNGRRMTRLMLDYRDELPRQLRTVFNLYYNNALTQEQIAGRLGLHRQTVARRLHSAETLLLALGRQDMRTRN